jgi:UDP-N-acetylglucosamine--N-acetylmuramyl-(pentapeptide) pyrophosphoryl-undecaprenol N-acetylglucosamine transferase
MPVETQNNTGKVVVLAAGGTGGHLFPAQALGEELRRRGYAIQLMTDERVKDYGKGFPADRIHEIPAATVTPKKPWLLPQQVMRLWEGVRKAKATLSEIKPVAVVGFGGYPSFPPIMAAASLKIPCCLHEQNAVMGRANRFLAKRATAIASSFPEIYELPETAKPKVTVTGNPVRDIVLAYKAAPYAAPSATEPFHLLVFGGSQGARFFADFMPQVVAQLPPPVLKSLHVTQQCRSEDLEQVKAAYEKLGLSFDLAPFFMDMPKRIAHSHLVICRSGASTIAELGVIGRPAIMVPLPHSLENDQLRNAESFAKAGAGWVRPQAELEAGALAAFLTRFRYEQADLNRAARAAISHGKPDAAKHLADLVERIAAVKAA